MGRSSRWRFEASKALVAASQSDSIDDMRDEESLHRLKKLQFKRSLRQKMTPAEALLWEALRNRKLRNTKWKRQANVSMFIADFLCSEYMLIVEVDGGIHETQHEYDQLRTDIITEHGYRVIRFTNDAIMKNLTTVLQRITEEMFVAKPR